MSYSIDTKTRKRLEDKKSKPKSPKSIKVQKIKKKFYYWNSLFDGF